MTSPFKSKKIRVFSHDMVERQTLKVILTWRTAVNNRLLLTRCITLLYRESLLIGETENSKDLVRSVLQEVQISEVGLGINTEREIVIALKKTVLSLCDMPSGVSYDSSDLLQRIRVDVGHDDKLYNAVKQGIEHTLEQDALKRSILSSRRSLYNFLKEKQIRALLNKATAKINYDRETISDFNMFLSELSTELDGFTLDVGVDDPAILGEVDLGSLESLETTFNDAKEILHGDRIFKTGFQGLNRMFSGGFRPGEIVQYGGLQHNYKSGMAVSLFAQFAMFNKPNQDPALKDKKPLILRISFEDKPYQDLIFLYRHIKFSETGQFVDVVDVTIKEMAQYVHEMLSRNGFHVKIIHVDPYSWSYKSIINKVLELEADGYSLEILEVDYLSKVGKEGLTNAGITGGEFSDLLGRVGSFCASKGVLFITPHQLSTEAKNRLREDIPGDQFIKLLPGRGYWEGNKGLDRIYDVGFYVHIIKRAGKAYLGVAWDKHRGFNCSDDDKFFMMEFPDQIHPVPYDIHGDDSSMIRFPRRGGGGDGATDMFGF